MCMQYKNIVHSYIISVHCKSPKGRRLNAILVYVLFLISCERGKSLQPLYKF